jgi:iron complex transport system permease protein
MLTKSNRHNYAHGGMPIIIGVSLLLFGLLILSIMVAVTIGSVDISVSEVYKIIIYKTFGIGDPASFQKGMTTDIVWFLRLPRL